MSRELMGANGYAVGSGSYFKSLNGAHGVSGWRTGCAETNYGEMLRQMAERARGAADEVWGDLRENIRMVRYLPRACRENLAKAMRGLRGLCALASGGEGRCADCEAILALSSYDTRTSSGVDDREIKAAAELAKDRTDGMELVRKAAEYGADEAAGGSMEKALFLRALAEGRGRMFFQDVLCSLRYLDDPGQLTGRNGAVLCSDAYIERVERSVFPDGAAHGRDYAGAVRSALEEIRKELERDLDRGERENAYLTDENAQRITDACKALASCGVSCYALEDKAKRLAWFVGGDAEKIRRLQHSLNELGLDGGSLTEDGVYGRKTEAKWDAFMRELLRGAVPTLAWVDPLDGGKTKLEIGSGFDGINNVIQDARLIDKVRRGKNYILQNRQYFRVDPPHQRANGTYSWGQYRDSMRRIDYNHINLNFGETPTAFQKWLISRYNHYPLSDDAYNAVKDLRQAGKKVRIAGKVLLVAGAALDALELGATIEDDLHDADRKIGKKTYSGAASIGGSWAGAALGAKAGAALGALAGPAAPIAVPVLGLVGGFAGSFGGGALGKWVVDITCAEE